MKQETLEEAYNRIFEYKLDRVLKAGFIAGAKWQQEQHKITIDDAYNEGFENGKHFEQERMYSEEDMIQFAQIYLSKRNDNPRMSNKDIFNLWFKQLKKK